MHSLENLRGLSKADHDAIHEEWAQFYCMVSIVTFASPRSILLR